MGESVANLNSTTSLLSSCIQGNWEKWAQHISDISMEESDFDGNSAEEHALNKIAVKKAVKLIFMFKFTLLLTTIRQPERTAFYCVNL